MSELLASHGLLLNLTPSSLLYLVMVVDLAILKTGIPPAVAAEGCNRQPFPSCIRSVSQYSLLYVFFSRFG